MAALLIKALCVLLAVSHAAVAKTPVIFDTDVGTDFDDSVSIAFALQDPSIDVRLILTATADTVGRARAVAKYLTLVGRTDVPIGVGKLHTVPKACTLCDWAADFDMDTYKGVVYQDGIGAAIDVVKNATSTGEHIEILAIAPCTNFPDMLSRYPDIVKGASVKAMSGSIYRGYGNSSTPSAEYNVAIYPEGSKAMYEASWDVSTTPLDTCGTVKLSGDAYDSFLMGTAVTSRTIATQLLFWARHLHRNIMTETDIWFDAVAAFMATSRSSELLVYKDLHVKVTDDGHTVVDPSGPLIHAAVDWVVGGEDKFEEDLAKTLAQDP